MSALFRDVYATVHKALFIYKLDAIEQLPKEAVIKQYGTRFTGPTDVRFYLENIGLGKKGWTRYYPFSIGDNRFIIRIFLTAEAAYQPKVAVLYEGSVENPAVTFQILPGLNVILRDCRIKPHSNLYPDIQASTSP